MKGEITAAVEQFLGLLQTQRQQLDDGNADPNALIEALNELIDLFSEYELLGVADSLALFAEQLEQFEQIDAAADKQLLLLDFGNALQDFIFTEKVGVWQYLLACLGDSLWPEPLDDEDCGFLGELLANDFGRLHFSDDTGTESEPDSVTVDEPAVADTADTMQSLNAADESDTAHSEPDITSPSVPESPAENTVSDNAETVPQTTAEESSEAGSEQSLAMFTLLSSQWPDNREDALVLLHDWVDLAGEAELSGMADLFALLTEFWELENDTDLQPLQHSLIGLLQQPTADAATALLELMQAEHWQAALPDDDRGFLEELLLEDLAVGAETETQLIPEPVADSNDAVDEPLIEVAEAEVAEADPFDVSESIASDSISVEVTAPESQQPFCEVDLQLLQQPGPELDQAVLEMLSGSLAEIQTLWQDNQDDQHCLTQSLQQLEMIARALDTLHLLGASHLIIGLQRNFEYLQNREMPERLRLQLHTLLAELIQYLGDITDAGQQQRVLDQLQATELPVLPTEEQLSFLRGLLAQATVRLPEHHEREHASAEDVLLDVSDDIDPQLLDMLFNELPTLSEELTSDLQRLADDGSVEPLRNAQRATHTIKGLANMASIAGIANLSHRLEDILEWLTEAEQQPGDALADDLLEVSDILALMCESVIAGNPAPEQAQPALQRVMDWHYRLQSEGISAAAGQVVSDDMDSDSVAEQGVSPQQTETESSVTAPQEDAPTAAAVQEQTLFRVPQNTLDALLRLVGESSSLNTQLDEEISQLRGYTRIGRDRQRAMQRVIFELEQQLNEYYTLQPGLDQDSEDYDPLEMDRYNEMHTSLSRLQEAAADVGEVEQAMDRHIRRTSELHLAQSGLQKETLERVLSTRLIEVKSISPRLQRVVRQACRATGKQAELLIEGEQTLIDSHILNQLADPLMHMIRNAVDHGLELPEQRQAAGKPEQGQLRLIFRLDHDLIRVTCSDDGSGIDHDKVQQVAQQRGLIEDDRELGSREIERLILLPGFSTRDEITQLSGRGVGMDVVHQQIMRLQGNLDIRSESGQGTTLSLSMPASSLMIKTLLVKVGRQIYALASHGLEQSLISLDGQLIETDQGMQFEHQGEAYPAYALEPLLGEPGDPYEAGQVHPVLLVNLGQGETVAVMVREVLAHRELTFKQMGDYLPDIPGIPGLTILANGDTAAVVDLPARIRHKSAGEQNLFLPQSIGADLMLPKLLVVDDSLSARSSLEILLRDTGYDVSTAIDGLDALNQIRKDRPDLVLTDLEMPRMSGMELTTVIRGREEMQDIPVLMITSRTTERHREEAESAGVSSFITKPWTENALLDQVRTLLQAPPPIT